MKNSRAFFILRWVWGGGEGEWIHINLNGSVAMFQAWIIERERGENSENCVAFGSFVYRLPCTISSLLFFYLEDKKSFCLISHTSFAVHPFCNLLVDATVVECLLVNYKRVNWGCLRCNWILLFLSSTFTCGDFARMTAGEKFISSNILWWNSAIDESNIKQTAFHSENRFFFRWPMDCPHFHS